MSDKAKMADAILGIFLWIMTGVFFGVWQEDPAAGFFLLFAIWLYSELNGDDK